jgi:hypothetical protein
MANPDETKPEETKADKPKKDDRRAEDIAQKTLTGDLRDIVLNILRTQLKPWKELKEAEQKSLAHDVSTRCENAAERAIELIAANGRKTLKGKLEQVTVKDGLKAVISMSKADDLRHGLIDAQGSHVLLVVNDASIFKGQKAPAKIDKDQPDLIKPEKDKPVADSGKNIPAAGKADNVERKLRDKAA